MSHTTRTAPAPAPALAPRVSLPTAWCSTCRRSKVIEETTRESWHERDGEHAATVHSLVCGHDVLTREEVTGRAPGDLAAETRAASYRAATRPSRALVGTPDRDPWALLTD